jgi:hypothetical protein
MRRDEELRSMDDAAQQSKKELMKNIGEWGVKGIARWWARWYMKAGHKRLGRLLAELAEQEESDG